MNLDSSIFVVHDVSRFPIVAVRNEAIRPGYAAQWKREMSELMRYGVPFAMLYEGTPDNETHEDFSQRGLWLKHNRDALVKVCRVLVVVEQNEVLREEARVLGRGATKDFGIPHRAVATIAEAFDIASYRVKSDFMQEHALPEVE